MIARWLRNMRIRIRKKRIKELREICPGFFIGMDDDLLERSVYGNKLEPL